MPPPDRGRTPTGFRTQLLQRLRNEARRTGIPVQRHQQRIAFERLLARLPRDGQWILKGGLALQFRYGLLARSTKDVDLRISVAPTAALGHLRLIVAAAPSGDNFSFEFGDIAREMQEAPGGTLRVKVIARIAGSEFTTFHIDLSSGDALVDSPDLLLGSDFLAFAGIAPVEFLVYPIAQHLAEKLHAYTLPAIRRTRTSGIWWISSRLPRPSGLSQIVYPGVPRPPSPLAARIPYQSGCPSRRPRGRTHSTPSRANP